VGRRRARKYDWSDNAATLADRVRLNTDAPTTFLALPGWSRFSRPRGFFDTGVNAAYHIMRDWDEANAVMESARTYHRQAQAIAGVGKELHVPAHAFSAVGVCPPYVKPDTRTFGRQHLRGEYDWAVYDAWRFLVPGGIALICLPSDSFRVGQASLAQYLMRRFEIVRFGYLPMIPNARDQGVAIVARAREKARNVRAQDAVGFVELLRAGRQEFEALDLTDVPTAASAQVTPFESSRVNPEEALRLAAASPLYRQVADQVGQPLYDATPPLPPKVGHVALNLSTGRLNGAVGNGAFRHVVNGRVVRATQSSETATEDGELRVVHDVLGVEITALGADGQVFAFHSGEGHDDDQTAEEDDDQ